MWGWEPFITGTKHSSLTFINGSAKIVPTDLDVCDVLETSKSNLSNSSSSSLALGNPASSKSQSYYAFLNPNFLSQDLSGGRI